jgi:hypothetical protein
MKKIKSYSLIIVLIVIFVANVFYTIGAAASGAEITKLENEATALASQNQNYKEQIMQKSSLTEVETKATELGFMKPQSVVYAAKVEAVAAKLP